MLQKIGMYACVLICCNVCGSVVTVSCVCGLLNEQLLAPAAAAAISLVSFIFPSHSDCSLLCCSNIYSNFCSLVVNRDRNGDRG